MSKTKIFIDFDGTLFDSRRFKRDIHQIPVDLGLDREVVEKAYEEWKKTHHPDPIAMLKWLASTNHFNLVEAIKRTRETVNNSKEYLFDDAVDFLEGIDRKKFSPKLLTLGYESFQSRKIQASGIADLFDEVIYTENEKTEALADLVEGGERFFVVDDVAVFMRRVKDDFGDSATIIGVDRYSKYQNDDVGIEFSPDLKDIETFRGNLEELKVA